MRRVACAAGLLLVLATAVRAQAQPAVPALMDRALARRGAMPVRWPRRPQLDVAAAAVGAPAARARFDATGEGATVCVIDTGIDLAHRDFRDRTGATRVRWLLDLDGEPRGGAGAELEERLGGAVWDASAIDAALAAGDAALPRDRHGHGTAVAAAAVGDDAEDGPPGPRAGVAPGASLVVVDAWRDGGVGFADDDLVAGLEFCAAVAGRGEEPVDAARTVVVLGLGGHDGAHDGSEPLERAVERLAAEGVPVVVAAGNDGGTPVHASGWLAADEVAPIPVEVPAPGPGDRHVALTVETRLPGPVSVAVVAPDGTRTAIVPPGFSHVIEHAGGRIAIDGERGERSGASRVLYVVLAGGGEVPRALGGGRYVLEVYGPGVFDAWLVGWDVGGAILSPRLGGPFAVAGRSVTIPGTAPSAVTVGATTPRVRVETDRDALEVEGVAGAVAPYSAAGPSYAGAPKPDLVAPGGPLVTALSGDVEPTDPDNLVGGSAALLDSLRVGDDRIAVAGTSFAASIVAGALALALSLEPSRGLSDRRRLVATARRLVEAAWDERAGAGALDVEAFLAARAGATASPDPRSFSVLTTLDAVRPRAPDLWLFARGAEPTAGAATLAVHLPGGGVLGVPVVAGIASARLPPPRGRVGDVLRYEPSLGGVPLDPVLVRLHVDPARDTAGIDALGAGCAAGGARPSGTPLLGVLALLLARVHRRRSCSRVCTGDAPARACAPAALLLARVHRRRS